MGDDVYLIDEWLRFANMDLDLAKHSFATMHPAPLEIICYHCQQAAEKFLKSAEKTTVKEESLMTTNSENLAEYTVTAAL